MEDKREKGVEIQFTSFMLNLLCTKDVIRYKWPFALFDSRLRNYVIFKLLLNGPNDIFTTNYDSKNWTNKIQSLSILNMKLSLCSIFNEFTYDLKMLWFVQSDMDILLDPWDLCLMQTWPGHDLSPVHMLWLDLTLPRGPSVLECDFNEVIALSFTPRVIIFIGVCSKCNY